MKTQFLAAAALVAVLAAPALAHAQDGYLDLGYRNLETGGADADGVLVGGAVKTEIGGLNLQLNANHARVSAGGASASGSDFVAHLYTQNDAWAVGGYVSGTDETALGSTTYGVGIEGQLYFGQFTLGANFSNNSIENGGGHFNNYGAQARWFATDNLALAATYDKIDASGVDTDIIGAEVEWKTSTAASLYASYGNVDTGAGDADKYAVGVRWNFGGKTLKEQERSGSKAQRSLSAAARTIF